MTLEKIKQALAALFLTFPAVTFSMDETRVLWFLVVIMLFDSIVAIAAAVKQKRLASWKMGQPFARKVTLYGASLFTVFILSQTDPFFFGWTFEWMIIFLILSEVLSIFENLAIFGFTVPSKLINAVNAQLANMTEKEKA